jgi:hypothetical protein
MILGLTGGTNDEWFRLQRNWRVAWLGTRIVLFATMLVVPMLFRGFLRRWAENTLALDKSGRS